MMDIIAATARSKMVTDIETMRTLDMIPITTIQVDPFFTKFNVSPQSCPLQGQLFDHF